MLGQGRSVTLTRRSLIIILSFSWCKFCPCLVSTLHHQDYIVCIEFYMELFRLNARDLMRRGRHQESQQINALPTFISNLFSVCRNFPHITYLLIPLNQRTTTSQGEDSDGNRANVQLVGMSLPNSSEVSDTI